MAYISTADLTPEQLVAHGWLPSTEEEISLHWGTVEDTWYEYMPFGQLIEHESVQGLLRRRLWREIIEHPEMPRVLNEGSIVRDNVCGSGDVAEVLMRKARMWNVPRPHIYSVDPTDAAIAFVAERARQMGEGDRWHQQRSDVPFAENFFDVAITIRQEAYYSDCLADMQDVYRTLKPGGIAIFSIAPYLSYRAGEEPWPYQAEHIPWEEKVRLAFCYWRPGFGLLESCVGQAGPWVDIEKLEVRSLALKTRTREQYYREVLQGSTELIQNWPGVQQTLFKTGLFEFMRQVLKKPSHDPQYQCKLQAPFIICTK